MRIITNPDKNHVSKIDKALQKNREQFGKPYCPCSLVHDDDHVCPCKDFIEDDRTGECHCGKYIKLEV